MAQNKIKHFKLSVPKLDQWPNLADHTTKSSRVLVSKRDREYAKCTHQYITHYSSLKILKFITVSVFRVELDDGSRGDKSGYWCSRIENSRNDHQCFSRVCTKDSILEDLRVNLAGYLHSLGCMEDVSDKVNLLRDFQDFRIKWDFWVLHKTPCDIVISAKSESEARKLTEEMLEEQVKRYVQPSVMYVNPLEKKQASKVKLLQKAEEDYLAAKKIVLDNDYEYKD